MPDRIITASRCCCGVNGTISAGRRTSSCSGGRPRRCWSCGAPIYIPFNDGNRESLGTADMFTLRGDGFWTPARPGRPGPVWTCASRSAGVPGLRSQRRRGVCRRVLGRCQLPDLSTSPAARSSICRAGSPPSDSNPRRRRSQPTQRSRLLLEFHDDGAIKDRGGQDDNRPCRLSRQARTHAPRARPMRPNQSKAAYQLGAAASSAQRTVPLTSRQGCFCCKRRLLSRARG